MDGGTLHRIKRVLLPVGWGAAVVAPLVSHAAITTGRYAIPAAVLGLVEITLLGGVAIQAQRGWRLIAGACGGGALIALLAMRLFRPETAGLIATSGLSHACIYLSLLWLFGRSLQPGRTPVVAGLASRIRGTLTPEIAAYTRNVTKAWCVLFTLQLVTSLALLLLAPPRIWSLFVNVLDAPMVGLMFAGEYAVRRWRFRGQRHSSPVTAIRSFARSRAH